MTRPSMPRRASSCTHWALFTLLVTLTVVPGTTHASSYERAKERMQQWRYDEARPLIDTLAQRQPISDRVRFLQANMSFVDGNYATALTQLAPLRNTSFGGKVGQLRSLATSTLAVTSQFVHKHSANGHFVIHYLPGKDEAIVELAAEVLETMHEALGHDLHYRPTQTIRVELLSTPSDLSRLSTLTEQEIKRSGTIALCKYGKLMFVSPRATRFGYDWMDTLAHEYTHYAVSQLSHDRVPVWLHEGLARFAQVRWRSLDNGRLSPLEQMLLARAASERRLIDFKAMHPSLAKLPSQRATTLAFAEVYSFVAYLHRTLGHAGTRRILMLIRDGQTADQAIATAVGQSFKRIKRNWRATLRATPRQRQSISPHRIQFKAEGDGAEREHDNVGVAALSSAKARKFARLGGLLRSRGLSAAAAVEYEKALRYAGGRSAFIQGKLSRTYLEVGRHAEAIATATPLFSVDEVDSAVATTLAMAYSAIGNFVAARHAFEAALRTTPFDPAVRCGLANVYDKLGHTQHKQREQRACSLLRK